eukprot:6190843-Pleurochrysis_carterae.AAC.1
MAIANALAGRITLNANLSVPTRSDESTASNARGNPRSLDHAPPATATATDGPSPQLTLESAFAPPQPTESTEAEDTSLQEHFQRGLGAYPLRNREPTALLTIH